MDDLSDIGWCALDVLYRAKQKGVPIVTRTELMHTPKIPQSLALKLTWALLVMREGLVDHHIDGSFFISDKGVQIFELKHGQNTSSPAEVVIALPDNSDRKLQ